MVPKLGILILQFGILPKCLSVFFFFSLLSLGSGLLPLSASFSPPIQTLVLQF